MATASRSHAKSSDKPIVPGRTLQRRRQAAVAATAAAIRQAVSDAAKESGYVSPADRRKGAAGSGPLAAAHLKDHMAPIGRTAKDTPIHGQPKILKDPMFYPQHDERTESAGYKAVHHDLVVAKNLPCLVCGVTNSILAAAESKNDPALNPYGAKQMETHHHVIEWALANAIDPVLFNRTLLPNLKARHADNADYQSPMSATQISAWVDHSPDNLWVLCDVHHRHKWVGIHEISYPLWVPQALFKAGFIEQVEAAEAKVDGPAGKKAPIGKTTAKKTPARKTPVRKSASRNVATKTKRRG